MEYPNHGRSDGMIGAIFDWNAMITNSLAVYNRLRSKYDPNLKTFLMGGMSVQNKI